MRWLRSLDTKAADPGATHTAVIPVTQAGRPYKASGTYEQQVRRVEQVVWASRAVNAVAENHAKVPMVVRDQDRDKGPVIDGHPLALLLNRRPNPFDSAVPWRQMLASQLMLSRRGVFVEVIRDRLGDPIALYLLPPGNTAPIPDVRRFVAGYEVDVTGQQKKVLPPEDVVWIRLPHPLDPYVSRTPFEAAGISLDIDVYARLYNRNFMLNDSRGAGLLILEEEADPDDLEEWKRTSLPQPGPQGAGQLGVLSGTRASYVGLATTPNEAQYIEARQMAKDEILIACGTPESVLGKASDRTYENAGVELEGFWNETMTPFNAIIGSAFDQLLEPTAEDFVGFDYSGIAALQRIENERHQQILDEVAKYVRPGNEYRKAIGEDPLPGLDEIYMPVNLVPIGSALSAPPPPKTLTHEQLDLLDPDRTNGSGHVKVPT